MTYADSGHARSRPHAGAGLDRPLCAGRECGDQAAAAREPHHAARSIARRVGRCLRGLLARPQGQEGVAAPGKVQAELGRMIFPSLIPWRKRKFSIQNQADNETRNAMSLAGQAVVAIWNCIAPEGRTEFYERHNREHMPERVGIPGFRRGRCDIAKYGTPEYFTLYEADLGGSVVGQDYLNRLNNPMCGCSACRRPSSATPRAASAASSFRSGSGGAAACSRLRFGAEAGREDGAGAISAPCRAAAARRHRAGHRRASLPSPTGARATSRPRSAGRLQGRHPELAHHDRRRNAGSGG